jgi:Fic family protein
MYTPKYSISNSVLKNIGHIEASKEVIENAPLVPSFEKQFQSDAIVRTVYHGTHIEGNDLTMIQTKKILEGQEVYGRPRDIQEVINYRNVMGLLDDLSNKRGDYESDMLLEIHKLTVDKIVPEEKVGVIRTTQVVVKDETTGNIIFSPPSFVEVPFLIKDFFEWLNSKSSKDMHPIIKAGIAHYILVAIHPFVEGNGRTARAFTTLVLIKEGYDIKRFFSLEEHFDGDPGSYYEAFSKVDRQSKNLAQRDLTTWLEYFTEVVAVELSKIKEKVRKLSMDTRLKTKFGEQISLSERQIRLVEYISDQGGATVPELRKIVSMISDDTILRDLINLIEKGVIKKQGRTKASRYVMMGR